MSVLPSWESLDEIQAFSGRLTWLVVISGAFLAAAGILQRVYDVRANTLQGDLDERQERDRRKLQERLDAAEGKLAPRTIAPEVRRKLAERLKAAPPPHSVKIFSVFGDSESGSFAQDFVEVFRNAGWTVEEHPSNLSPTTRGYCFVSDGSNVPANAHELIQAFRGESLMPIDLIRETGGQIDFRLCVFSKPDGTLPENRSVFAPGIKFEDK